MSFNVDISGFAPSPGNLDPGYILRLSVLNYLRKEIYSRFPESGQEMLMEAVNALWTSPLQEFLRQAADIADAIERPENIKKILMAISICKQVTGS